MENVGVGQRRKGKGTVMRAWVVVSETGEWRVEQVGKQWIMRRTGLPARDLRALDPKLYSYTAAAAAAAAPCSILGREHAIVINLEHINAIVTAKEVLFINSTNPLVLDFLAHLQRRIIHHHHHHHPKPLPFEFRALEACLESACASLESQTQTLEQEAYPALDELTTKISSLNLERVRQIKSRLVAISGRVQNVRDQIEQLLDDDNDMAELYLTEKLNASACNESLDDLRSEAEDYMESVNSFKPEELEMLLSAYFVQIDGILQKLSHMKDYVDDTENCINITLDDKQNQLLQMGVIFNTINMIINAGIVVVGIFGMNIHISLFDGEPKQFWEATFGTVGGCIILYLLALGWGKKRYLFPS